MTKNNFFLIFVALLFSNLLFAQTKVSGIVIDKTKLPVPYANVIFKGTNVAVNTDENGRFYLESDSTYTVLEVSFVGYNTKEIQLTKSVTYDMKIVLSEGEVLNEVLVYSGKTSKKNNPALDILRKIWERKRKNEVAEAMIMRSNSELSLLVSITVMSVALMSSSAETTALVFSSVVSMMRISDVDKCNWPQMLAEGNVLCDFHKHDCVSVWQIFQSSVWQIPQSRQRVVEPNKPRYTGAADSDGVIPALRCRYAPPG